MLGHRLNQSITVIMQFRHAAFADWRRTVSAAWQHVLAAADVSCPRATATSNSLTFPARRPTGPKSAKIHLRCEIRKVLRLSQNDRSCAPKSSRSPPYGIDPMHIVGAIVGEHTYNVDAYDRLQTYYVKAIAYVGIRDRLRSMTARTSSDFINRPQFDACNSLMAARKRSGPAAKGSGTHPSAARPSTASLSQRPLLRRLLPALLRRPDLRLGQLNPLTALQMRDRVNQVSGLPKLDVNDANEVYKTIMDPDLTLPYVAATVRNAIDAYKTIAGFDISQNPASPPRSTISAIRKPARRALSRRKQAAGQAPASRQSCPEENYYGWLINDRIEDLKALF